MKLVVHYGRIDTTTVFILSVNVVVSFQVKE